MTEGKFSFRSDNFADSFEASSLVEAVREGFRRESFYRETSFHPENRDQYGAPRSSAHSGC